MFSVLVAALLAQAVSTLPAVTDVRQLSVSEPRALAEIDSAKVQGAPVGLAWKTDGTIYVRVQNKDKARHYQIATSPEVSIGQTDGVPAWAAEYWTWKAATVAPGDPTLKLDVEQRADRTRSVNAPGGGELAGMGSAAASGGSSELGGVSQGAAINAANGSMAGQIYTLRFKGQVVGEWSNTMPQPGMRIGWAPAPMGLLAYCDKDGRLVLADRGGHRLTVPGTKAGILPAWSTDGKQIVYLQKKSSSLYALMIADVR